ncbi:hypothetical protein [Streptomyces sp. Da 82-17]|uniref:hypothetical protein n=1 Tax=Streptomyces sp. Da 82-17 TaxID=3377116 RepID=UPI0038D3AA39
MPTNLCCTDETCHYCRFWLEKVAMHLDGDQCRDLRRGETYPVARVNGHHYAIRPHDPVTRPGLLGFYGQQFTFHFHDGREITSNDVMSQGDIPARFRDRLPDNAVIVPQPTTPNPRPFGREGLT